MAFEDEVADLFNPLGASYVVAPGFDYWPQARRIRGFVLARLREVLVDPERLDVEARAPFQERPDERALPALNVIMSNETASRLAKGEPTEENDSGVLDLAVDVLADGDGRCTLVEYVPRVATQPTPSCRCVRCRLDQLGAVVSKVLCLRPLDSDGAGRLAIDVQYVGFTTTMADEGDAYFGAKRLAYRVTYTAY